MIKQIEAEELRKMSGKEGLILQGCGGDPQEWLDGINDLFTKEGILLNGAKFENAYGEMQDWWNRTYMPVCRNRQLWI